MKITQQLVTGSKLTSGTGNPCTYITVHETANTSRGAGAQAHANLQSRGNVRQASWHYQVDDKHIIQSHTDTTKCWHAGTAKGNTQSIAIEICVNPDSDYAKAVANAAWLVRTLMARHNVPLSRVVQHHFWTGKNCPTNLRKGGRWEDFLKAATGISGGGGQSAPSPSKPKPAPAKPAKVTPDGFWGKDTTRALQRVLGTVVDGEVWGQWSGWKSRNPGLTSGWKWTGDAKAKGSPVIAALQKRLGITTDGKIGPSTIRALQKRYGLVQDGELWAKSPVVKALQKHLNEGKI